MPKKPEQKIEDAVCDWCDEIGIGHRKMEWVNRKGAPDRFFVYGDKIRVIEFKAPGKKPKGFQALEHEWFADHGYIVPVFDNVDKAIEYLTEEFLDAA